MALHETKSRIPARILRGGPFPRSHPRFELELNLTIQILIPEDTFQPHNLKGRTTDVSARGMQVELDDMHADLYMKLLARTRHVRVCFVNPANGQEVKLTGLVSWIDYHKPHSEDRTGRCNLGVFFDDKEGIDLTTYTEFILSICPTDRDDSSEAEV